MQAFWWFLAKVLAIYGKSVAFSTIFQSLETCPFLFFITTMVIRTDTPTTMTADKAISAAHSPVVPLPPALALLLFAGGIPGLST